MNQCRYDPAALCILSGLNIRPRHTSAAVRIIASFHGNFCSVVNARTSRHCKKYSNLCKIFIQILHIRAKPLGIMRIEQIKQHIIGLLHIACIAAVDCILKVFIRQALINPEILDTLSKRIIHYRIKLISAQPRKRVVPDFSENIDIRVDLLDPRMQFFAEPVGNFICHIQTDSIDSVIFHPVGTNIYKIFAYFRIVCIDLWHGIKKGKCIILFLLCRLPVFIKRPFIDHKPVIIFRLRSLCKHILPRCEIISGMIEHTVKHYADAPLMRFLHKVFKGFLIAKTRINLRIIRGIIFVI